MPKVYRIHPTGSDQPITDCRGKPKAFSLYSQCEVYIISLKQRGHGDHDICTLDGTVLETL